jgi:hypothetical protein
MDRDLAREIIRRSYRSGSELEGLIGVLKARCNAEDYKFFARQVAMAIDGIHVALVDKVLSRYPELEAEMEANLARTGRVMP